MPVLYGDLNDHASQHRSFNNEREILYQVLFDMKKDMRDLKALVHDLMQNNQVDASRVSQLYPIYEEEPAVSVSTVPVSVEIPLKDVTPVQAETAEYVDASLSLEDMEKDAIRKALERHGGRRKNAAEELNISERTLYRKIKLYHLD